MNKPKMILFDYGQTLINELYFDGEKGTSAVMQYVVENKYGKTPKEIQEQAGMLNREVGRFDPARRHLFQIEIPWYSFSAYIYESNGITLSIPYSQAESIFWDESSPGVATEGIEEFLDFLHGQNIRTGVISNISYSGASLRARINRILPNNKFEFILASSEYVFRKPNRRIFELALEKAELRPEEVWYIGDQYECDIVGAKNAGLFPIWYTAAIDFDQNVQADTDVLKVGSWTEVQNYLRDCI